MKRQTQSLDNLTKFTDLSILTKNIAGGDEVGVVHSTSVDRNYFMERS